MAETFFAARIPTFDQGTIAKIRSGAIEVIDGTVHPLDGLGAHGVELGGTTRPFDDVILATGFAPGLEAFIADGELLGSNGRPLTDGRCRSRVHPSIFFPGFDVTPLGGLGLGRWGWEVGDRIAEALGGERRTAAREHPAT